MTILIREANSTDISQLQKLFLIVRQKTFTWRDNSFFSLKDYEDYVLNEKVLVAEIEKSVIGFISIFEADDFIHNLYIHPDFQGRGAGQLLLKNIIYLNDNPKTLKVEIPNKKAQLFYEKFGFKKISSHENEEIPYYLYKFG
jgi:ribosomal protein S18 acetylase RimI-like enzyme